jgi:hypothetical protein
MYEIYFISIKHINQTYLDFLSIKVNLIDNCGYFQFIEKFLGSYDKLYLKEFRNNDK